MGRSKRNSFANELPTRLGRPYRPLFDRFGSRHAELLGSIEGPTRALALGLLLAVAACSDATEPSEEASAPALRSPQLEAGAPAPSLWPTESLAFFTSQRPDPEVRHVHLMHLDGFHAGLFERLLAEGMLPHFSFLLARGKLSTVASTVDKSETFKVIQAYLTSRLDTRVTGWWQFSRDEFGFRNFWLDPVEVANYAVSAPPHGIRRSGRQRRQRGGRIQPAAPQRPLPELLAQLPGRCTRGLRSHLLRTGSCHDELLPGDPRADCAQ
jgi:hypothetical protein